MADGYTLKELVQEVRKDNKEALAVQASMLTTLQGIDTHLEKLNSKVATHEKEINRLDTEHTKVKAYATAVSMVIGVAWTAINFVWK